MEQRAERKAVRKVKEEKEETIRKDCKVSKEKKEEANKIWIGIKANIVPLEGIIFVAENTCRGTRNFEILVGKIDTNVYRVIRAVVTKVAKVLGEIDVPSVLWVSIYTV